MTENVNCLEDELKIVAIADLHIGDARSHYSLYVKELWQIREELGALILLGDTIELRHPSWSMEESWRLFEEVRDTLEAMGLRQKTIMLRGNHDASIDLRLWEAGLKVRDLGRLWCEASDVYLVHGSGLGLENAIARNRGIRDSSVLALWKRWLIQKENVIPELCWLDWLVTGHFEIPVCDPLARVCGVSSAIGDPHHGTKGRYVCIDPHTSNPERQVMLRVVNN